MKNPPFKGVPLTIRRGLALCAVQILKREHAETLNAESVELLNTMIPAELTLNASAPRITSKQKDAASNSAAGTGLAQSQPRILKVLVVNDRRLQFFA